MLAALRLSSRLRRARKRIFLCASPAPRSVCGPKAADPPATRADSPASRREKRPNGTRAPTRARRPGLGRARPGYASTLSPMASPCPARAVVHARTHPASPGEGGASPRPSSAPQGLKSLKGPPIGEKSPTKKKTGWRKVFRGQPNPRTNPWSASEKPKAEKIRRRRPMEGLQAQRQVICPRHKAAGR